MVPRKAFVSSALLLLQFTSSDTSVVHVSKVGTVTMPFRIRPSNSRGHANHGWLDSYHTFSFASYHDPQFDSFGPLRVINEDTVEGGHGFDPHPHRDFCIFSYLLSGALRHQDSMGNTEILKRGALQYTEAGVGIRHSEYNAHASEPVRFLQIWVSPWTKGLPPRYATGQFSDGAKRNVLLQLLSPALPGGKPDEPSVPGTLAIAADFSMYASLMEDGASATHTFAEGRRGYLHVPAQPHTKAVSVNGTRLGPGDGLFIEGVSTVEISGETHGGLGSGQAAEFVLFDLR